MANLEANFDRSDKHLKWDGSGIKLFCGIKECLTLAGQGRGRSGMKWNPTCSWWSRVRYAMGMELSEPLVSGQERARLVFFCCSDSDSSGLGASRVHWAGTQLSIDTRSPSTEIDLCQCPRPSQAPCDRRPAP